MEGKALTMVITVSCVLVPSPLTLAAELGGVSLLIPPTPSPPRSAQVTLPPISLRKQEEDVQGAPRGIASACTCPRVCSAQPNAGLAGAAGGGASTPVLWLRLLPPAQLLSFSNSDQSRITLSPSVLDLNNP